MFFSNKGHIFRLLAIEIREINQPCQSTYTRLFKKINVFEQRERLK